MTPDRRGGKVQAEESPGELKQRSEALPAGTQRVRVWKTCCPRGAECPSESEPPPPTELLRRISGRPELLSMSSGGLKWLWFPSPSPNPAPGQKGASAETLRPPQGPFCTWSWVWLSPLCITSPWRVGVLLSVGCHIMCPSPGETGRDDGVSRQAQTWPPPHSAVPTC